MKEQVTEQPVKGSEIKKFRDTDSLRKAYEELEAQFTKKSQQLAALQRESNENAAWNAELAAFTDSYPRARDYMQQIQQNLGSKSRQGLTEAYLKVLSEVCRTPQELERDEQFCKRVAQNEDVRKSIINDYLAQLAADNSPVVASGGYLPLSPRKKADTLDEAGAMTQGLFK